MEPVNRCQSATSTHNPVAVSVETPRRQRSRPTGPANAGSVAAISVDRGVEAVAARMDREHRVQSLVEGQLHPAPVEALAAQPVLVRAGPRAVLPDQALAQQ